MSAEVAAPPSDLWEATWDQGMQEETRLKRAIEKRNLKRKWDQRRLQWAAWSREAEQYTIPPVALQLGAAPARDVV